MAIVYGIVAITESANFAIALRRNVPLAFALALVAIQSLVPSSKWRRALIATATAVALVLPVALADLAGDVYFRIPVFQHVKHVRPPRHGRLLMIGVDGLCSETLRRWEKQESNQDLEWFSERGLYRPDEKHHADEVSAHLVERGHRFSSRRTRRD